MAAFETRRKSSESITEIVIEFLRSLGFKIEYFGYENHIGSELRDDLRKIHDNPTISHTRYIPDYFAFLNRSFVFWLELKNCNTPIKYESRVTALKNISHDQTLSKENIGAIETAALNIYRSYAQLGIKILIIVYSNFHSRNGTKTPLIVSYAEDINIKHADEVRLGEGNASWTPYSNVNLDEFIPLTEFLNSIGFNDEGF